MGGESETREIQNAQATGGTFTVFSKEYVHWGGMTQVEIIYTACFA